MRVKETVALRDPRQLLQKNHTITKQYEETSRPLGL